MPDFDGALCHEAEEDFGVLSDVVVVVVVAVLPRENMIPPLGVHAGAAARSCDPRECSLDKVDANGNADVKSADGGEVASGEK